MDTAYNPKVVESSWYEWWDKLKLFVPNENKEYYSIVIPPPNVTGSLHLGHALTIAIQDCMIRWNRMRGKSALFLPGIDHAGIGTQIVVEKKLQRERNLTRHDLGREEFIKEVWKWKEQFGTKIYGQIKKLGGSNDFDRAVFTMDPKMSSAVNETFVRLHNEGIIYRENRLVNWCTKLRTALSNLEVENVDLEGRTMMSVPDHDLKKKYEFGVIISFKYLVEASDETITVATTRLETMLGDTAVAVHPTDKRYSHLVGKNVVHPFSNKLIPIIADEYVDPAFGTGAVKITPAHDFNDYIVGKRNNLETINIFNDDGKVNEVGGPEFEGLQRFDARIAVLKALTEKGLYVETKPNKMMLPICARSGNIVEPLLKPQWWVKCQDMADEAMAAVTRGDLQIVPSLCEKDWFRWLTNSQDWCISRQLWWGHRIPAYLISIRGEELDSIDEKSWVSGRDYDEAFKNACDRFNDVNVKDITLAQDPDVLDTWFSSALWPFATLGWPEKSLDMEKFYPTSLLETGWDILFFWVARMVMFGIKLTGQVPFKKVFCHAMVRDAHGRKMSKSLGNVIDPLDVIRGISLDELHKTLDGGNLDPKEIAKAREGQKSDFPTGIPQCGADALRFTLLAYTSSGRDINLDVLRIEGYRKFCNKIWNATKFAMMKLGNDFKPKKEFSTPTGHESLPERWILHKLNKSVREVNQNFEEMNFLVSTSSVYNFWLYEFCDVYIECCKFLCDVEKGDLVEVESSKDTLYTCLETGLKLLHPIMPFVTEELFQRLPRRPEDEVVSISVAKFPEYNSNWDNPSSEEEFNKLYTIIRASRSLITDYNVKSATVYVQASTPELLKLTQLQQPTILNLVKNLTSLQVINKHETPIGCASLTISEDLTVFILVKGVVDMSVEIKKYEMKLRKTGELLETLIKKIGVADYEVKVKVEVREGNDAKVKALETEIASLKITIENFEKLK